MSSDQYHSTLKLFACWVIFHAFFLSLADFFSKLTFSKNSFRNTIAPKITIKKGFLFTYWEILHTFLLSADFFQNQLFSKNSFRDTIRMSNSLDPDQARQNGPKCLQRLSADNQVAKELNISFRMN